MGKNKYIGIACLILSWMAFLPVHAFGQQVYGISKVDSAKVGDTFNFILLVKQNKPYDDVIFPDSSNFGNWFQINSVKRFKTTAFSDSLVYSLQFFGVHDTTLGPIPVKFVTGKDTIVKTTVPIPIFFRSEIKNRKTAKFQPLKPIYQFAIDILPYLIILLLILIIGWYSYKIYKKKKSAPPKPAPKPIKREEFVNPLELLEKELQKLQNDPSLSRRDFKTFYSNFGDTIRTYFEILYKIPALEYTTRELVRDLDAHAVDKELIERTSKILRQADMVKFAKFDPTLDQAHYDLEIGQQFLTRARQVDTSRVDKLREKFEQEQMAAVTNDVEGEKEEENNQE